MGNAERFDVAFAEDEIVDVSREDAGAFDLRGRKSSYRAKRVLLATGIFHIPPDIEVHQVFLSFMVSAWPSCQRAMAHNRSDSRFR